MNIKELKTDCKLKVQNLKTASESLLIDDFNSTWMLENYLKCVEELKENVERLMTLIPTR